MQFQASALLLLGASSGALAAPTAECVGPAVNQATLDLVKEFEGWEPDICTLGWHPLTGPGQIQIANRASAARH